MLSKNIGYLVGKLLLVIRQKKYEEIKLKKCQIEHRWIDYILRKLLAQI
jgi:hypothetical protein